MFFVKLQEGPDFSDVEPVSGLILDKSLDYFGQEMAVPVLENFEFVA